MGPVVLQVGRRLRRGAFPEATLAGTAQVSPAPVKWPTKSARRQSQTADQVRQRRYEVRCPRRPNTEAAIGQVDSFIETSEQSFTGHVCCVL